MCLPCVIGFVGQAEWLDKPHSEKSHSQSVPNPSRSKRSASRPPCQLRIRRSLAPHRQLKPPSSPLHLGLPAVLSNDAMSFLANLATAATPAEYSAAFELPIPVPSVAKHSFRLVCDLDPVRPLGGGLHAQGQFK